jgi:alkylation response protein AidB-like acyl-CoA dehydrogenase
MRGLAPLPAHVPFEDGDLKFRDEFGAWLEDNLPAAPEPAERRARYEFGRQWQRTMAGAGLTGVTWPSEFGGMGASPVRQYIYYEELARVGAPDFPNRPGLALIGPALIAHGDQEIQRRYLPGILTADEIWAQCFSEPDAGSDLAAVRTSARLDGGSYRIDGQKTWTTAADLSTHAAVLCRTGDPAARHRTLTLLLIDLDQPGIEIRPIRTATGDTEFSEVFFAGAETPANHAVGGPDRGWAAAMTMLEYERGDWTFTDHRPLFAQIRQLWAAVEAGGTPAGAGDRAGELKERLAGAWMRAHQLRELNISVVFRRAAGVPVGFWTSPVKVVWAQLNQQVQQIALDASDLTPGLAGTELGAYLKSRMSTVYSGAIDIQRSVVAERLLGLPRASGDRPAPKSATPGGEK